jgi:hypothetical protein
MSVSPALRRAVQRLHETEHCNVCRRDVPSHAYDMAGLWCEDCAAIVPRITESMARLARVSAPW